MTFYRNKFKVETARLKEWDYTNPWWYYITINTKNHLEYFGDILNHRMALNVLGSIANEEWLKTKELRNNIDLDHYVIMPNHIHGIIILNPINDENKRRDVARNVSTTNRFSEISPKSNSLSAIIRAYKSMVSKRIHENGEKEFLWQPRFYDRKIRNEKELDNIRNYIQNNPLNWELEKELPENIFE